MSAKNSEYDFKWCPGCGDFGVRRALDGALKQYNTEHEVPASNNVVVAGIGCSGNMVHLLEEDEQPFGIHGIHGRTLPIALGVKMARPELNVVVAAGDGDFLSIGQEHIAPQAARNLNITAIIMDNGVYGLTKGQSSPTTKIDTVTSSTPFGKLEEQINPLKLYLTLGVSYISSQVSNKIRDLSAAMVDAMNHPGFSIVHVHSPCTIYNDTYKALKGDPKNGVEPMAWNIDEDHDPSDMDAAYDVAEKGGVPVGLLYKDVSRPSFDNRINTINEKSFNRTLEKMIDSYAI